MTTIDIGRDAARDAAQAELAKPIYPKGSWTDYLVELIDKLLYRLAREGASVPGGWFTITVLLLLLAAAIVVAARIARNTMRTSRDGRYALFDTRALSAAEHRATAEQFAASGDWAAAIRHRLRAVARELEETAVLDPVPGRTATELAREAGRKLPTVAEEFTTAAVAFNDVTYGQRPGTEGSYRMIADLDDHVRAHPAAAMAASPSAPATDGWAELR
ncbi:DUF4129 domain-containing protein [Mycolicibacterium sp. XJ1819]